MIDYRENAKWTVYVHIVPKTISGYDYDKYYVGITSMKPKARWGKNGNGYNHKRGRKQFFYNAIQKYGWNNIEHYIFSSNLTENEAKEMEKTLICKLNSNGVYGYNLTNGGDGMLGFLPKNTKPLYQFDLQGNFVRKYDGCRFVMEKYNIADHIIKRAAKNHKQLNDFLLCYEEDLEIKSPPTIDVSKYKLSEYQYYEFDVEGNFLNRYYTAVEASKTTGISKHTIYEKVSHTKGINSHTKFLWKKKENVIFENGEYKIKNFILPNIYVYQFDIDGNFINKYDGVNKASEQTGIDSATISHHLNLKYKGLKLKLPYIFRWRKDIEIIDGKYIPKYIKKREPKHRDINHGKRTYVFDKDKNYICECISIREASKKFNISEYRISNSMSQIQQKPCEKYYFRNSDYIKESEENSGSFIMLR